MNVDYRNITAQPIENGFTWTLASRLGQMLSEAEAEFGERDKSFTLLGVEFREDTPQIWYPSNCKHIVIQLSVEALGDFNRACYQLSHEVIHLLSPNGGGPANVIEEGLSTHFSQAYMAKHFQVIWSSNVDSYEAACLAVRVLLSLNPDAIREMRKQEPSFSKFTPPLIESVCPTIESSLSQFLCQPFCR